VTEEDRGRDATTLLGAAVVLLAAAGICALLGGQLLLGALRLAAGILTGLGLGALVLALLRRRPGRRAGALIAGAVVVVVALALTVPAVLLARPAPLEEAAAVSVAALGEGDTVHSVPGADAPVLVRRADGSAELLGEDAVVPVDAAPEDVLALSADGTRLVQVTGRTTTVSSPDGAADEVTLEGTPLALDGDLIVLRHCAEGDGASCSLSGYDLGDPDQARWTVSDAENTRGTDPRDVEIAARPAEAPGPLDALRATGVLPAVPLRFDPAQGWIQLDPATGFPVGSLLTDPDQDCRIAATGPDAVVLTVCSAEDGALTATAHQRGEVLWESEPSPAGEWTVRLDQGRVLATGTEEGTDAVGEIVAAEHSAAWTAPGAEGLAEVVTFTSRIGIDGGRMVVANASGQLVAYDTADGTNTWTLPLSSPEATVRGALDDSTAVVLDPVERTRALEPRGTQRLRVIDAATGDVTHETETAQEVSAVHGVGDGRALVTVGERTLLLRR
jgi:PQQ-like domain